MTADVNVGDGGKLVIEPCAVVQVAESSSLNVGYPDIASGGELVAEGRENAPIRFVGRDERPWGRVFVRHPGKIRLAWVTLEHGGGGASVSGATVGASGDGDLPSKPVLFVDHVSVRGSVGTGVRVDAGGAFASGSKDLFVTEVGSNAHPYPLEIGEQAIGALPAGRYTGNLRDGILVAPEIVAAAPGLHEDATMHDVGVPYRIGSAEDIDHLVVASGAGGSPVRLTIEEGVRIELVKGTGIDVASGSSMRAVGSAEKPIVFTSASKVPQPGDWRGLRFEGKASAENELEHVRLEYTGAWCSCSLVTCSAGVSQYEGAIVFFDVPPRAFMKNSEIRFGSGHGVVAGYDGNDLDWKSSNTIDVAGCPVTMPRASDGSCPEPLPSCR